MASQKALEIAKELKDRLARRLPSLVQSSEAFGSVTNPDGATGTISTIYFTLSDGSWATTEQGALIQVREVVPLGVDAIGLQARGYAQTVIQVALETNNASPAAGLFYTLPANLLNILGEVQRSGTRVELYGTATGTLPTSAAMGTLLATWEPDLQFRLMTVQ